MQSLPKKDSLMGLHFMFHSQNWDELRKGNLEIGRYDQVPALSTTREEYLDFGFCGKLKEDGCVIEG